MTVTPQRPHAVDRAGTPIDVNLQVKVWGGLEGRVTALLPGNRIEIEQPDETKVIVNTAYVTVEEKRAKPREHRVRTPEGARKYGVPIGSIITLDADGKVVGKPKATAEPAKGDGVKLPAGVTRGGLDKDGNRLPDSDGTVRLGRGDTAAVRSNGRTAGSGDTQTPAPNLPGGTRQRGPKAPAGQAPVDTRQSDPGGMGRTGGANAADAMNAVRNPEDPYADGGKPPSKAEARLAAVKADLETRAAALDAEGNTQSAERLRALAEDPSLVPLPEGLPFVGAKDAAGGYALYEVGEGYSLSPAGNDLKKGEIPKVAARLNAATANGDGDTGPLFGSPGVRDRLRTWKQGDKAALDVLIESRAAWDSEQGKTDTSAQRRMEEMREMDARRVQTEQMAQRLTGEGLTDAIGRGDKDRTIADVPVGAEVAYSYSIPPGPAFRNKFEGLPEGVTRVLVRGTVSGQGVTQDRHGNNYTEFRDGVRYPMTGMRWETEDGTQSGSIAESIPPTIEWGTTVYLTPHGGKPTGSDGPSVRDRDDLNNLPTEADERRQHAESLAATAGEGDEVLSAADVLQRTRNGRSGDLDGRRVRVAGNTSGKPIEGVLRFVTPGGATTGDAPSPEGTLLQVHLTTDRGDGDTGLPTINLTADDRLVLLADAPAPDPTPDEEPAPSRDEMASDEYARSLIAAGGTAPADLPDRIGSFESDVQRPAESRSGAPRGSVETEETRRLREQEDRARQDAVTAAWGAIDDDLTALAESLSGNDRDDALALRDRLRQDARDSDYDVPTAAQRQRRARLAGRDLDTLRSEHALLGYRATDDREDYEAEFRRRGLSEDGTLQDPETASAVAAAMDLLDPSDRSEEMRAVEEMAGRYIERVGDSADSPDTAAAAVDLLDALDVLAGAGNDRNDAAIGEIRGSLRPEHRAAVGDGGFDNPDQLDIGAAPISQEEYEARVAALEEALNAALASGQDTESLYSTNGVWTAERRAQQQAIVDTIWAEHANVPRNRQAIVAGGLGGSGKGTVLGGPAGIDSSQYLTIDPDEIKGLMIDRGMAPDLEGFTPLETAALIHEESSLISEMLRERAQAEGMNIILDMTMGSRGSVERKLDSLAASGYDKPRAIFVTVPLETSVDRALSRHRNGVNRARAGEDARGGRYVPPRVIRLQEDEEYGSKNRRNFYELQDRFADAVEYDNSGRAPRLVQPGGGAPAPVVALEDATWGDVAVGDRIFDDGREAEVTGVNDGGRASEVMIDVRYADGSLGTIFADRGLTTQRVAAAEAVTIPLQDPTPPPIPDDTPRGRVYLSTAQRAAINAYALDSDPSVPEDVRHGAARLRARQPLSEAEHRALAAHLRRMSEDESIPARRRAALARWGGRFDVAADSATVSYGVRGTGRRRPPNARFARAVAVGDLVRIPATQGYDREVSGRVVEVRREGTMRTIVVQDEDGQRRERTLLGGTYVFSEPGFGAEPVQDRVRAGDLQPGDRVDLGDGVPRTIVSATETGGVVAVRTREADGTEETNPFGPDAQVARIYGPDAPPVDEPVEPPAVRTVNPAEVEVGSIVIDRLDEDGRPIAMRVTSVTPVLGGSHYRIVGELDDPEARSLRAQGFDTSNLGGRTVSGMHPADAQITVLPDPGEDVPLPDPNAELVAEQIPHDEIRLGDRLIIRNPRTGGTIEGLVTSLERADDLGEDDEGNPLPGTRFTLGRNTHTVFGDEQVEVIERLGEEYAREADLNRRARWISLELHRTANDVQRRAAEELAKAFDNAADPATINAWQREAPDGGTVLADALWQASGATNMYATNALATRGVMGRPQYGSGMLKGAVSMLLQGDATPEERAFAQVAAENTYKAIAAEAIERIHKGLREGPPMTAADLRAFAARLRDDPDAAIFGDYSAELAILARSAPALRPAASGATLPPAVPQDPQTGSLKDRMAAYRKALPTKFGSRSVTRPVYRGFDLESLGRGEVPEVVEVPMETTDVAADGGPGESTMAHLETVKAAGRVLQEQMRERVDRILYGTSAAKVRDLTAKRDALNAEREAIRARILDPQVAEATEGRFASMDALLDRLRELRVIMPSMRSDAQAVEKRDLGKIKDSLIFAVKDDRIDAIVAEINGINEEIGSAQKKGGGLVIGDAEFQALLNEAMEARQSARDAHDEAMRLWLQVETDGEFTELSRLEIAKEAARVQAVTTGDRHEFARLTAFYRGAEAAADKSNSTIKAKKRADEFDVKVGEARRRRADNEVVHRTARARAAFEVLSEVRDMGPADGAAMVYTGLGERSELTKGLRWAEQHYPTEWLRAARTKGRALNVKSVSRGFYDGTNIALSKDSGDGVIGSGQYGRVALHELGHHFERMVTGLANAENAFLWSRTTDAGTEIGSRTRNEEKNRHKSLGYRSKKYGDETSRRDDFIEGYTGKEYSGSSFEVFTTGIESLFGGSPYIVARGPQGQQRVDEDFESFMLGALALL